MNKYLKMLMLSGGIIGAIAPTAIDMDKTENNDLGAIYEQVEKMQETLPRLSRINYKLNIDLSDNIVNNSVNDDIINNDTTASDSNVSNSDTINDTASDDSSNTTSNITFTTTDDNGNESNLTNQETLNYLNQTLEQTNIEYEQLKNTLSTAIKDTMDYLDAYKNGETTLTNEQKIYIKEHSNSIKFLAETLEDLSEDIICCIDGCDECENDEDFDTTASKYLTTINDLETRIDALNNAIASLQFINNIGNPFFRYYPNHIMYVNPETNNKDDSVENDTDLNINNDQVVKVENNQDQSQTINEQTNNSVDDDKITQDNVNTTNQDSVLNNDSTLSTTNEDTKPTTFGLKSNIDTYAPTKRNIDTFFNTALYNNEYMNGYNYGYGMPYGYGGYGMPYGAGYYVNPYGQELNSNLVNRAELEKPSSTNSMANIENDTQKDTEIKKPKKIRAKRAKNIDTYTGTTIQSNVNSMGESKISKFFKEKFNNLRNKVKKQKNDIQENKTNNENLSENTNSLLDNNELNNAIDQNNNLDIDDIQKDTTVQNHDNSKFEVAVNNTTLENNEITDNTQSSQENLNIDSNNSSLNNEKSNPKQEKDIKAKQ